MSRKYRLIKPAGTVQKQATAFCYILIDNYDDLSDQLSGGERSAILSGISTALNNWANAVGGVLLNYDGEHFVMIFDPVHLPVMEEERFKILDQIREMAFPTKQEPDGIHVTVSMGIGVSDEKTTISDADGLSHNALEFALARGGDQCVVRRDDNMYFYGGKTEAAERRTKVKARVKAHALRESMINADNVLVMGHQTPDMDCLSAAVGLMGAARWVQKECKFILKEKNFSIANLMDYISKDAFYANGFIQPADVADYITDNTLLIIVDTQNPNFVEMPDLLSRIPNRVLIDHHRRTGKSVEATLLNYVEPYASSTAELVTELLQYFTDHAERRKFDRTLPTKTEANALMAGICMDTKMFTVKTGVRTFEAASFLKRKGGDTAIAKILLQNDLETYAARSYVVQQAKLFTPEAAADLDEKPVIAISTIEDDSKNAKVIAAQAADELLNIRGIHASFVILKYKDSMVISGRSTGTINVQLILEKLGGGGHLTIAGAQLYDVDDLERAKNMLTDAIEAFYVEKGEL